MKLIKDTVKAVLSPFAFSIPLQTIGRGKTRVPILHGIGLDVLRSHLFGQYRWMSDLLKRLSPDHSSLFVDVGAHLGETLITIKSLDPEWPYLGFEANPLCADYLKTLVSRNAYTSCTLMPLGLADVDGETTLYLESPRDSGATIVPDLRPGRSLTERTVPTVTFDNARSELGPGLPVGFVKIDVEGAELKVLSGMTRTLSSNRPMILCEVLWADFNADGRIIGARNERMFELLTDLEYSVYQVVKDGGGNSVSCLRPMTGFETMVWSADNRHLCDYLFIPAESRTTVERTFLSSPGTVTVS